MKKLASILMSAVLMLGVTSCGNKVEDENNSSIKDTEKVTTITTTAENNEQNESKEIETSDKKTLVVYFSASGNTERVGSVIAGAVNGDTFELIPKNQYTDDDLDWTNDKSRVNSEHDDESKRNIELESTTPENWDNYDTVFIGYPIWWGIAAWPVDNFVKNNNFDGKTVIPFCTSTSSGLGESGELLKDMAGTGNWLEGERFSSRVSDEEVTDWVNGLNLQ